VVVIVIGLAVWWAYASLGGGENGNATGVRPVARLAAPDVHSLLVDPSDPDHILFGAHSGIQESHDGGFSWEAGTLRNADAMSMAVSPLDPATLYVAGHNLFLVSRDGGRIWQPVQHDLPGTDLHAFAQDPTDPRHLYALVVGTGIMTSLDGGATWSSLPSQPPGIGGQAALVTDGAALYAATAGGIMISRDQGTTWASLPAQPAGSVVSLAIAASNPTTIFAGTQDGLSRSTDDGARWTTVGPQNTPVLALAVAPSNAKRVVVVSENGAVYRSDDGGASWVEPR